MFMLYTHLSGNVYTGRSAMISLWICLCNNKTCNQHKTHVHLFVCVIVTVVLKCFYNFSSVIFMLSKIKGSMWSVGVCHFIMSPPSDFALYVCHSSFLISNLVPSIRTSLDDCPYGVKELYSFGGKWV